MAPLQPAADIGKAVDRGERDQQARDERDVEHEESPKRPSICCPRPDDNFKPYKSERSKQSGQRKERVKF